MTEEKHLNIKKRAVGLLATAGLVGGLFTVAAPAAHAVTVGGCTGIQFLGTLTPPLAADGSTNATVASLKTAKAGLVVWGPGFASSLTTTGAGNCTFPNGAHNDALVGAKLSGAASCVSAGPPAPNAYPLNGKMKISYAAKALSEQAYIRVAGFDPVPGPDVIAITGIDVKGSIPGSTVSGETFFDPVLKSLVGGEQGGPELKGQYYFDNSQIAAACGSPGSAAIGLIYGGDGISLLGSVAPGLAFDL
jgi:hypothetical protein